MLVTPDTVLRWQRRRFREHWTKLSGRPTGGRPPVNPELRALVARLTGANPLWGAPRIHGELLKLGIDVAKAHRLPASPEATHPAISDLASVPRQPCPGPGVPRFLHGSHCALARALRSRPPAHHRRRVLHFNVIEHPTAAWTAQQIVDAFPDDPLPSYLLRDRDKVYGDAFRQRPSLGVCVCQVNTDARQASRTRFWRRTRRAPTATSSGSGTSAAWTSIRCWAAFSRVPRRPRFWTPGARLRGNCAIRQAKISWWRVRDSNPRPRRCERRALPTELTPRVREQTSFYLRTWRRPRPS